MKLMNMTTILSGKLINKIFLIFVSGVTICSGGLNATEPRRVFSATVAINRQVQLVGVQNSRDLGGVKTRTGKLVLTGKVLRTAALFGLTDASKYKLQKLGLTKVIDLRTDYERLLRPDPKLPQVTNVNRNILGSLSAESSLQKDMTQVYGAFVTAPEVRRQFALAVKDIVFNRGTILYHCSQGKDRTGWLTVIIYEMLGVPRETIVQDYLLSNKYLNVTKADALQGVILPNLQYSYAMVWKKFGSMSAYLSKGLGITAKEISLLRDKLLAK